jgi:hypothetical protein
MARKWLYRMGAACVLATFVAAPAVRADEIDPLLYKDSADLMELFRSRGYKNIGVLKFEVQRGGDKGPVSMANGSLNSMMATRLENALILANDDKNPIGITRNASEVAAKADKNAGYHTKAGRDKLFDQSFPLAWGTNSVKVDAFVTGRITVAADYKKSTVLIRLFDRKDAKILDAARFTAPVDRSLIVDIGQPFAVSKAVIAKRALLISPNPGEAGGTPTSSTEDMVLEDVQKSAKSADDGAKGLQPADPVVGPRPKGKVVRDPVIDGPSSKDNPLDNKPAGNDPVRLDAPRPGLARAKAELDSVLKFDVYYNDQLVAWTADNRLPTPEPGTRIEFRVRATEKIGMVLRVNGVNTADYDRTQKQISDYSMWVLDPNKDYTIRGFYPTSDKVILFTAANRDEVDSSELGNENRIGKIDLDILREAPNLTAGNKSGLDLTIAKRGLDLRATASAKTMKELKGQLRQLASRKATILAKRGPLIVGGDTEETEVTTTSFVGVHAIHMPITYSDARDEQPRFLQPEND